MATAYRTPGVYIEEIPKFPPSIAQVETAIPAFIGYTEKADNLAPNDLHNVPTKIGSMIEYELYFGYGPSPNITDVIIDDNNNFVSANVSNNFFMYDSLRLFFANGGGDCYIVSVATYTAASKTKAEFTDANKGIKALEKFDEPTIIVMPDTVLLTTGNDMYDVQQSALAQCADLQDRVAVFDLKQNDPKGADFRNKIGINNLKYGMAYTPWLKVNLPKNLTYSDVKDDIKRGSTSTTLSAMTTDATILAQITNLENITADVAKYNAQTAALAAPSATLRDRFSALDTTYTTTKNVGNFRNIFEFIFNIARKVDDYVGATPAALQNTTLKDSVKSAITSDLRAIYNTLVTYEREAEAELTGYNPRFDEAPVPAAAEWGTIFSAPAAASAIMDGADDPQRMDSMIDNIRVEFDKINKIYLDTIGKGATTLAKELDTTLQLSFPAYKNILTGISNSMTAIPPSGAVVGVYAMVDRTRGVWKAPANVSLSFVIEPDFVFSKSELDALNVDVVAGKSINAIRTFFGKGTLIYGGRTLAGNDNEWRYVSVRRFFNMVEESTKKATEQFVFEPNDANTWVKVQAMIENFLMVLWRQGALQGAKPEQAFYVAIGLGKTMTALDILEGRMNVEIGMAVVRPAEFIILKFSHKLPE
jgi:uncharacterized protein